ncbi:MAG: hypothetical protein CFE26_01335 [Verrucomicrobiales bacterium VVV1]|nr:MAG: hypothetical protein CFE26_01335 [Verrucomicrobiales bacterium VVV1]
MTAATAVLTSCVDPYYGQGQGYPQGNGNGYPGGGYPSGGSSQAYRTGQTDGARDKAYNRPYNPYRGQASVAGPFQDNYRSGYATGYRSSGGSGGGSWGGGNNGGWGGGNNGGWGGGNNGGWGGSGNSVAPNERLYSYGNQCGLNDRRSGGPFNPARYNQSMPATEQVFFNKGYLAGWNGKVEQY